MTKLIARSLAISVFGLLCGFTWFVIDIRNVVIDQTSNSDCIVVLTGGGGRISAGVSLLKAGLAKELFISGVNPAIEYGEIAGLHKEATPLFDCCIVLGHRATDTIGNAEETADWLASQNYHSIRLVTSDYHMPRALLDFHRVAPDISIIPNPIRTPDASPRLWPLMLIEYGKYLVMLSGQIVADTF